MVFEPAATKFAQAWMRFGESREGIYVAEAKHEGAQGREVQNG